MGREVTSDCWSFRLRVAQKEAICITNSGFCGDASHALDTRVKDCTEKKDLVMYKAHGSYVVVHHGSAEYPPMVYPRTQRSTKLLDHCFQAQKKTGLTLFMRALRAAQAKPVKSTTFVVESLNISAPKSTLTDQGAKDDASSIAQIVDHADRVGKEIAEAEWVKVDGGEAKEEEWDMLEEFQREQSTRVPGAWDAWYE
ncbi:hypothetical protein LTR56_024928 [Elasticomyces elasticus]|nr:hypothetical protein LTR56_024928 [Elasticomyces elasticus]KAK3641688.1 hypothetical protein LTR22_016506 [Elasticomyces elasticus]KAK4907962.1 hypothetical protein LTR49_023060 [Elasticomyces elasticus]KAK5741826.1 hypothetical protein LTS12_024462 [Elasticomyces elasticus]